MIVYLLAGTPGPAHPFDWRSDVEKTEGAYRWARAAGAVHEGNRPGAGLYGAAEQPYVYAPAFRLWVPVPAALAGRPVLAFFNHNASAYYYPLRPFPAEFRLSTPV